MKIKVSDAEGTVLDWMVAKCEGAVSDDIDDYCLSLPGEFAYSTDPAQAWPIIEREGISMIKRPKSEDGVWTADNFADPTTPQHLEFGPTALIAAMRCFIVSRLGEEVEVPDEL